MKRIIGGSILIFMGLMGLFQPITSHEEFIMNVLTILLFCAGGGLLLSFGVRAIQRKNKVLTVAWTMISHHKKLNMEELAKRTCLSLPVVNEIVVKCQQKGTLPYLIDME